MTAPIYGLTPAGFNTPRLANVKQFLEDDFIAAFGDVNLDPQSVIGQLIGIFSKSYADQWENLEDVYFSQYPNSAAGVSLDNVVQLNGITRLPATQTSVVASCQGLEGTFIPQNSLARIETTGETFYAGASGTITRSNADLLTISVDALATQVYTVVVNNRAFTFSKPRIIFSNTGNIFVSGNSILITINGVQLPAVPFNTSSDQTLSDVRDAIGAFPTVATSLKTNPDTVTITSVVGETTVINSISITGGATQASYSVVFRAPLNFNEVTQGLAALINNGSFPWLCVDNMDHTITITANTPAIPFSCALGVNLTATIVSSPITFLADVFGPVPCPAGTLNTIVTPIAGWNAVTNILAGNTGTLVETDAQLRIRRQNSIKLLGSATVEAITAGLLQKVPGVTSATVFENVTLQQTQIQIIFPQLFTAGDVITSSIDGTAPFAVNYSTSQAVTMGLLVAAYQALPQVLLATYGGTGNQTLFVNVQVANTLFVDSVTADVSAQQALINGGRPPKSFEAVVEGGSDEDVANQIWLTKPAGIETFGNTQFTITDSQGNPQVINFSRPTAIYLWVQVALTLYAEETFPSNGVQLVADAIYNYGVGLGVGIDVLLQRVLAQIFSVPGIASGNMTIASTASLEESPSFGSADISIADNQISVWSLERISVSVV